MADKVTYIVEFFGDKERKLCLHPIGTPEPLKIWRELEEKTNAGPMRLFTRIRTGDFHTDDIREIIRLALIGGGETASAAHALVARYFDRDPLAEHASLALDILVAGLFGVDPDAPAAGSSISPIPEEVAAANAATAETAVESA